MVDSVLLGDLAAAIEYLQSTMTFHGLGEIRGIVVSPAAHVRLSSLRLANIVELDEPRHETDPEICGVPFRQTVL
jgi:hypothetical protein